MGLQKFTLLDYPGITACTVFTGGCNLRCPFCHNSALIPSCENGLIHEDDILVYLKKRKNVLKGVCISGGEPLLQHGLADFIKKAKAMGYLIKLDTNGTLPQNLASLISTGLLDYVAMDIKNSPQGYAKTAGLDSFDLNLIAQSLKILESSGISFELRTTLVKNFHSDSDLKAMGEWIAENTLPDWQNSGADCPIANNNVRPDERKAASQKTIANAYVDSGITGFNYYLQAFEASDSVKDKSLTAFNKQEMLRAAEIVRAYVPSVKIRGI